MHAGREGTPPPVVVLRRPESGCKTARVCVVPVSADVSLAYDTFGDPGDPAVLLVMGFGAQPESTVPDGLMIAS